MAIEGNDVIYKEVEEIQPIDNIVDIVRYLDEGKVLRLDQEGTFVLVRLRKGKYTATETSLDTKQESFYYNRYWIKNNISINALINFTVYLDEEWKEFNNQFSVGESVKYTPKEKDTKDLAFITKVLVDNSNNFYYTVTNDSSVYSEDELISYK